VNRKKSFWSLIVLLVLIGATLYYLFRNNDMKDLLGVVEQTNPLYLLLGLVLMFVFVASEGMGIQVLLWSLKYRDSFWKCLKYSFLGFYYCSIMPASGGQPIQIYYMSKEGISPGDAALAILIITIAYQIGILFICLAMLLFRLRFLMENLGVVKYFAIFGAAVNAVGIFLYLSAALHSGFVEKIIAFFVRLLAKIRIVREPEKTMEKVDAQLANFCKAAAYVRGNPKVIFLTLISIVIQVLSRLSVAYAVYRAFGLSGFGFLDILALQAFLALGVEYMPIPGTVGVAEAGFIAANSRIFGADRLVAATLLTRGINYYAYLLLSGAVAVAEQLSLTFRGRKKKD